MNLTRIFSREDLTLLPDGEIVRRILRDESRAFEELVRRHRGIVVNTAHSILGDADDSQDVAQETFATAAQRMGQLNDADRVRNWLVRIARNTAIEFLRKRRNAKVISFEDMHNGDEDGTRRIDQLPDPHHCPRTAADNRQTFEILYEVLDNLPTNYRVPLLLRVSEGLSYQDIADQLGLTLSTTKVRIFRAREMLIVKLRERDVRLNYREGRREELPSASDSTT